MVAENDATAFDLLLEKVYRGVRPDFRGYKHGTVTRRLERRLHATGVKTYLEYMQFLDAYPEEYQRLADDLTINLIYLQKQLQERVLGMLYDSLATPGYLILGEVETPTDNLRGRLECLDTKARIYKKDVKAD